MTAPQPAPEEQNGQLAVILAALVAAILAGMAVTGIVRLMLRLAGMQVEALLYLFRRGSPTERAYEVFSPRSPTSAPESAQFTQNVHRRAAYLVNAGRRLSKAFLQGGPEGLQRAYEAELRYWQQHLFASQRRSEAAEAVAEQMEVTSRALLGWHAVLDERTSGECRTAHGRNFDPTRIPPIGFPGSVHPYCRCRAGLPFVTAKRVETIRPDHRSWSAA